jgi:hypothetical protein
MKDDDRIVLICWRVDHGGEVVKDSIVSRCDQCGTEVNIAPTGQEVLKRGNVRVLCSTCSQPFRSVATEAPGAIAEAIQHHLRKRLN